ncbi:hypothetical protein [Microlunatus ginsengisoli]|uniref:Uncharacterized protein n=1 Tax=Microlunatus ginsengisoli TaxID=363863 RepID=A0ABP7AG55_9ACTN
MPQRRAEPQEWIPHVLRRSDPDPLDDSAVADPRLRHAPGDVAALQRAAGNRAVCRLVEDPSGAAGPIPPVTIQRWAWVSAAQVKPDEPGLDARMKTFTTDNVVRDYGSMSEFADHAAGKTDYLGNLPATSGSPGTWVRFAPGGTNLLGEDHTLVTMEHVAPAVGSKSFTYEPFATDDLSSRPGMRAAYETENADRFKAFGVDKVADKRQFGGESLFPKIGFAFVIFQPYADGAKSLDDLKPGGYVGQPLQRYLKIAWGYAADVVDEVDQLKQAKTPVPPAHQQLAATHAATKGELDGFIQGLPVDGYLGDALDTTAGKKKLPALSRLSAAVIASMTARMEADTGITQAERNQLKAMPRGTPDQKGAMFGKWRNLYFSHAVRDAVARGVRYVGMGREHLDYLKAEGLPAQSRGYDMVAKDLNDFATLTNNLKSSAKP